jgi:hypothetical protein
MPHLAALCHPNGGIDGNKTKTKTKNTRVKFMSEGFSAESEFFYKIDPWSSYFSPFGIAGKQRCGKGPTLQNRKQPTSIGNLSLRLSPQK